VSGIVVDGDDGDRLTAVSIASKPRTKAVAPPVRVRMHTVPPRHVRREMDGATAAPAVDLRRGHDNISRVPEHAGILFY
jgi:hypothetical protein